MVFPDHIAPSGYDSQKVSLSIFEEKDLALQYSNFLHTFIPATDFSINFPVQIFPCTILKVAGHLCRKLTQIPNIPNWNSYGK